jgi:predicted dienelactone hydrolase
MLPIALLLLACTPGDDTADTASVQDPFIAPDQAGPYLPASYEDLVPGPGGLELPVQVWFPASEADEDPYEYDDLWSASALEDGVPDCSQPRPVLLFSHGNSGMRFQSVFLTERLATRGWVVVAPDHVHNTYADYDDERLGEVMFRRPEDIVASFDWLVQAAAGPGGPLEGCVDEAAGYAVAGHSFGGFTAAAVAGATIDPAATAAYCEGGWGWLCSSVEDWALAHPGELAELGDPRVWASIPMAPAGYEALIGGLAGIEIPGMVLGGSADSTTSMAAQVGPIFEAWGGRPAYLGEIRDAGHYAFSNACEMLPFLDECEGEYIEPEAGWAITNTLVAAFLGRILGEERYGEWLPPDDERLVWTEAP